MSRSADAEESAWWAFEPLKRLTLANNHITAVPDALTDLSALVVRSPPLPLPFPQRPETDLVLGSQYLDLTDNQIEELPKDMGNLLHLQKLYVS